MADWRHGAADQDELAVIPDDDVAGGAGFAWCFTTRKGASHDVASLTLRYTFLTLQT